MEPGSEKPLDRLAARWVDDPPLDLPVRDDYEGRHLVDPEALVRPGPLLDIDPLQLERRVVGAPLEYLGEEAVDAPTAPGAA